MVQETEKGERLLRLYRGGVVRHWFHCLGVGMLPRILALRRSCGPIGVRFLRL